MGRSLTAAGAIAILVGGAAVGYSVTRKATRGMTDTQRATMGSALAGLDGDIKAAQSAVRERASTLSGLLPVRAAVATDVATVADQVARGELAFPPSNGEILELGRIVLASKAVETLMLQPAGNMRVSHGGQPGGYVELMGERVVITEIAKVVPAAEADKYVGYLSVTRPLDLGPAIKQLVDAGITGKVVVADKETPIGAMPADATTREQPLTAQGAKLVISVPERRAAMPLWILLSGVVVAAVGLLLLVVAMMGRRGGAGDSRMFAPQLTTPPMGQPIAASPMSPSSPSSMSPPSMGRPDTGAPVATGNVALATAATQISDQGVAASGTPSTLGPAASQQIYAPNIGAGSMIGRWEVVRRLGSGGMADVYLAQAKGDGGFEKLVAIKVMHGHLARTQRAVDHFLDEARLAARIHHPNVVAIQDLGKIGEDYVIVMEYVDGVDLERLLMSARAGERPVPLAVGLGILCRICDGLDAAHRATSPDGTPLGIVHRDVKSANVLVSRQGIVKVVDFGIAKASKQVHQTIAGETKGTPSMMAPEQRVGDHVDVRADVYSVAAVGYEIVTGHGVNLDLAALAHLGVEKWPHLPPPSSLRPQLPLELDDILLRAMAFERERRPADCAVLEEQCESIMRAYNLSVGDKDIARWVESELRYLGPAFATSPVGVSRAPIA